LLLFCPVSEVATSRAENNTRLGNTFFITSMYLGQEGKASGHQRRASVRNATLCPATSAN
jgi:hypothetical protein